MLLVLLAHPLEHRVRQPLLSVRSRGDAGLRGEQVLRGGRARVHHARHEDEARQIARSHRLVEFHQISARTRRRPEV